MSVALAAPSSGLLRSAATRRLARQFILFIAMLMSGGLLIFPRPILLGLLILACAAYANPLRLVQREFGLIWLLLAAVAAMAMVGGLNFQLGFMAIRYANFIGGLMLLLVYVYEPPNRLAEDIFPILRVMAVQAILTPILAILVPNYFSVIEIADLDYRTLLLIFTYHAEGLGWFKRPDGLFYEPGVFQLYLNLYLFIALFIRRLNWIDVALGVASVVFTLSTAGAIVLMFILVVAYARYLAKAGVNAKILFLLLAPLFLLPPALYVTENVNDKFAGSGRGSAWARQYDLYTGLAVVRERPLTGIGFDYERYYQIASRVGWRESGLAAETISERGNSNGVVTLVYSVGIPLALIFLWGLFRQRMLRPGLVVAAVLFVSLLSEALFFTPFVLAIVFSGLLVTRRRHERMSVRSAPASRPSRA